MAKKQILQKSKEQVLKEAAINPNLGVAKLPGDISMGRKMITDYMEVPCEQIVPFSGKDISNDFSQMPEREFRYMVESVRTHGILEALSLRMVSDHTYEVLAGEHRLQAAKEAGLKSVPAKVYHDLDDKKANIIFRMTNLVRRDMTFLDKVNGWHSLWMDIKDQGARTDLEGAVSQSRDTLGMSIRQIQRYAKMFYLIPEIKDAVDTDLMFQNTAYNLAFLEEEQQQDLLPYLRKITLEASKQLKELGQNQNWSKENIEEIILGKKKTPKPFSRGMTQVRKYAKKVLSDESLSNIDDIFEEAIGLYLELHPEAKR